MKKDDDDNGSQNEGWGGLNKEKFERAFLSLPKKTRTCRTFDSTVALEKDEPTSRKKGLKNCR